MEPSTPPVGDATSGVPSESLPLAELRATMEKTRDALAAGGSKRKAEEFWKGAELRLPAV